MQSALVIGLGFAGSVLARELAEAGFSVIALEKRHHIAGNMYECTRENGIRVHLYGPHIFHTYSKVVYDYLCRFSAFYPYTHRVLGKITNHMVPIPFNFTSIDNLFPKDQAKMLKTKLWAEFGKDERIFISQLMSHTDPDIAELGEFIYMNVFVNYTSKQWGIPVNEIDASVINRVPVVLGRDDRYFNDPIQMMPQDGFTPLFERMLDHPNIQIHLETDALDFIKMDLDSRTIYYKGQRFDGPICYSGALDQLWGYRLGDLPYRSLEMRFEDIPVDTFQPAAVVNYPNDEEYTRITEFKHMTAQSYPGQTSILKEIPLEYKPGGNLIPYYPISSQESQKLYNQYRSLTDSFFNLYLCGRLAEYRYYNMDGVIEQAINIAQGIKEDFAGELG